MRIQIYLLITLLCLAATGCWFSKTLNKGAKELARIRVQAETEFNKVDAKVIPLITQYEAGKKLYYTGLDLLVVKSDTGEYLRNDSGSFVTNARFNSFDTEMKNFLREVRRTCEKTNDELVPLYTQYVELKAKAEKTDEDVKKLENIATELADKATKISSFFESAATVISKVASKL